VYLPGRLCSQGYGKIWLTLTFKNNLEVIPDAVFQDYRVAGR
jgi:hypothetical protein